ncbi:unnamed protein product [Sphagnum troendelagicum]|uniref:Uncharacterized protein n=1 Tax=Sphagnum troendelagicum TaxID=128251 RepID=A0ABP0TMR6_9BRYO
MTDQRWKRQKGTKIGSQKANESRGAEEVGDQKRGTAVIAWLSHTGESLRHLTYEVPMATLNVNMLERCGKMRYLESLRLRHTDIRLTTDPTAQRFMCLSSLTLYNVVVLSIANASWPSSY